MGLFDQKTTEEFKAAATRAYFETSLVHHSADEIIQNPRKRRFFIRKMRFLMQYFPMSMQEEDDFEHTSCHTMIGLRKAGVIKTKKEDK